MSFNSLTQYLSVSHPIACHRIVVQVSIGNMTSYPVTTVPSSLSPVPTSSPNIVPRGDQSHLHIFLPGPSSSTHRGAVSGSFDAGTWFAGVTVGMASFVAILFLLTALVLALIIRRNRAPAGPTKMAKPATSLCGNDGTVDLDEGWDCSRTLLDEDFETKDHVRLYTTDECDTSQSRFVFSV
jgi:hypothetical protein